MVQFFLNRDSPVIERFPYNLAPTAWLANCYNGVRNRYLRFRAKRDFQRECSKLLDAEDLVKRLQVTTLEPGRFTRVSSLGIGASANVELVKDTEKKNELFAMKIFTLKNTVTSPGNCSSYVEIKVNHKLRGTTKFKRWEKKQAHVPDSKKSASESASSFLSDVLSSELVALKNEIHILRLLRNKPYVINFHGAYADVSTKNILLCMQFCDTSLGYFVTRSRLFAVPELQAVATSILLGLCEIHKLGYVHLDIKPENILMSKDGKIRICDFGSAVKIGNVPHTSTAGTGVYYSPELHYAYYIDEADLNFELITVDGITSRENFFEVRQNVLKSDVWAFGVTMLMLCVGEEVVNALMEGDEKKFLKLIILHMNRPFPKPTKSLLSNAYLQQHDDKTETRKALRAGEKVLVGLQRVAAQGDAGIFFPDFIRRTLMFKRADRSTIDELLRSDFVSYHANTSVVNENVSRKQSRTKAWSVISDLIHSECKPSMLNNE